MKAVTDLIIEILSVDGGKNDESINCYGNQDGRIKGATCIYPRLRDFRPCDWQRNIPNRAPTAPALNEAYAHALHIVLKNQ